MSRAALSAVAAGAAAGLAYLLLSRKSKRACGDDEYPVALGAYHQRVRTASAAAQKWFDRGCVWTAGYHREEAHFCFTEAVRADPSCAMAHWGVALVNGPDYNFHARVGFYQFAAQAEGWPSLNVAHAAIVRAKELAVGGPAREQALIDALACRYEWPLTDAAPALQDKYAEAMEAVAARFPADADVQAACAEALLCLSPWDLYDKDGGATTPVWCACRRAGGAVESEGPGCEAPFRTAPDWQPSEL